MLSTHGDLERTFPLGRRALELMKAYGPAAYPRSYEVWYTYASGEKPLLNETVKRMTAERGCLRDEDIDALYESHLSGVRLSNEVERTGDSVIVEIDQVMSMIDIALGSTAKYGESLEALSNDLAGPADRARVREVIGSLVLATKEVTLTNRTLETRLKDTRGEIETLRETLEAVRIEALTDPLTGIANRKHFEKALIESIDHASSLHGSLALVVIDIDSFKHFNDTYGHLTGDQVLRLVSMTMRENVRIKATLARFGGEEFGIILPNATLQAAYDTAEHIRQSVMSRDLVKRSTGESLGRVTISVGVAAWRPGDTATSLLDRADQCMFAAKRAGRNRTVIDADRPSDILCEVA